MLFTFKRDEEGRERIYVGDVCVAYMADGLINGTDGRPWSWRPISEMQDITVMHIQEAIERADEAGFWASPNDNCHRFERIIVGRFDGTDLSVTVGGDES